MQHPAPTYLSDLARPTVWKLSALQGTYFCSSNIPRLSLRAVASSSSWKAPHPDLQRVGSLCHSSPNSTITSSGLPWAPKSTWLLPPLRYCRRPHLTGFYLQRGSDHCLKLYFLLFNFFVSFLRRVNSLRIGDLVCLTPRWIPRAWLQLSEPLYWCARYG